MQFQRPNTEQVRAGIGAMKYLAFYERPYFEPAEREMLAGVQRVFETAHDIDVVEPQNPFAVARRVSDPQIRRQILCALVVFSLIDGQGTAVEARVIDAFAHAFGVEESAVRNLERLARREYWALRIDVLRRFWAVDKLRERVAENGFVEILRFARANVGRFENPELAERFAKWRTLPEGTLGREYLRYLETNGWPMPGERGALSDIIVYHDMTHVLADYGTDPASEIEVACFSAGCRAREPFTFVLFVLLQFHVGIRMTPGSKAERGYFDVERALGALERGAAMNVDLTDGWSYWEVAAVPVAELRRRYNILPKSRAG